MDADKPCSASSYILGEVIFSPTNPPHFEKNNNNYNNSMLFFKIINKGRNLDIWSNKIDIYLLEIITYAFSKVIWLFYIAMIN